MTAEGEPISRLVGEVLTSVSFVWEYVEFKFGHPLLRAAAQGAAMASKFSPTKLSGQPVKVNGVIIYNFVAQ